MPGAFSLPPRLLAAAQTAWRETKLSPTVSQLQRNVYHAFAPTVKVREKRATLRQLGGGAPGCRYWGPRTRIAGPWVRKRAAGRGAQQRPPRPSPSAGAAAPPADFSSLPRTSRRELPTPQVDHVEMEYKSAAENFTSIDMLVRHRGAALALEVDGPFHFTGNAPYRWVYV